MVLVVALNTYKAIVQTSISFLHAKMYYNCVKHCNICCISNTVIVCKNNAFKEKKNASKKTTQFSFWHLKYAPFSISPKH